MDFLTRKMQMWDFYLISSKKFREEMVQTCIDAVLEALLSWNEVEHLEIQLRFINMFMWCFSSWDSDADLSSTSASIESIWGDYGRSLEASFGEASEEWELLTEKIDQSRSLIHEHCGSLILKFLKCKPLTSHEIQRFLHMILVNVDFLLDRMGEDDILMRNQIEDQKEKLLIFMNLVQFTALQCLNSKVVEDFNIHVLTWSNKAACMTYLYFAEFENRANITVTDLLQKANPCTPEFIEMCFEVITLTRFSRSDILLFVEFVSSFIDLLFTNLMFISLADFGKLREGLIYVFIFLASPRATSTDNPELILFRNQIDAVLNKASHLICMLGEAKVDSTNVQHVLAELMNMIDNVRGNFDDQHLVHIPHSSNGMSKFPRTNGLGFIESLLLYLTDLEEEAMRNNPKIVLSMKQQILSIKKELSSLRPFLLDISDLLIEHKDLEALWEEIITVAHQAEIAIRGSFFMYHPFCLSSILLKFQDIKPKVMRVKGKDIYTTRDVSSLSCSSFIVRKPVPLGVDEEVVGFEKEIPELVDRLTRGTSKLDIVSIVGMAGIGKTTLSRKIFNEKPVMYHFHARAFCSVSQVYRCRNMLLDILSHLIANDNKLSNMTEEDLAYELYKGLKGRRYLIVLDDIWNVSAWNDVKDSFPDDGNGSRVVFTTRISEVPLLAKPDCSPHMLRFLTFDESWDLLRRKIFHNDPCPPDLSEVGKLIAGNCKGLPLAVVVVGGLLAKTERSISWWQEVAYRLSSFVFEEGCRDVLELSYKHLPNALRSCLLYFSAFSEDTNFRSGDITKLWVAEGFIPVTERSCMGKVAKEHLNHLGDRSLIIVDQRSLAGNIKYFRVHDLIRDFCITKAQEENLLCLVDGHDDNISMPVIYDGYRVCAKAEWRSFLDANPRGPNVHSLLCLDNNDEICMDGYFLNSLFRNFKLIQVLHLPRVLISDLPTGLVMIVHLRYLKVILTSLSWLTIANLRNLETLVITMLHRDAHLKSGDTIWSMTRLRHLKVDGSFSCTLDNYSSQLPDLETIGWLEIPEGEKGEELLRKFPNLRKLSCWCYPSTKLDILTKLESLEIRAFEERFYPSAISCPSTLRKLTLLSLQLSGGELSTMIGNLPFLQVLKLLACHFDGKMWDMEDEEFPHLKFLELNYVDIKYWNVTTESFCCLEKLVLQHCSGLSAIPPCFGEVATLKTLQVRYCSEGVETSGIQIQEDQSDMGNDTFEFVITREETKS